MITSLPSITAELAKVQQLSLPIVVWEVKRLKFRKFFPTRPEGAEALSPGLLWTQAARPEGAEALSPGLLWTQAARPEGGRSS